MILYTYSVARVELSSFDSARGEITFINRAYQLSEVIPVLL
jgi:hypothetical protein